MRQPHRFTTADSLRAAARVLLRSARRAGPVVAAFAVVGSAGAVTPVGVTEIHTAAWGDNGGGPNGEVTPLSPTSFLTSLLGPDDVERSGDEVTLLVTDVGGTPQITPLSTPDVDYWAPGFTAMGSTRAVVPSAGPDHGRRTADDLVYLLDRLGSDNVVTPIAVGPMDTGDGAKPVALDTRTFVVVGSGPDLEQTTQDDQIALVTDVGGANAVEYLPVPFHCQRGRGRPVALSTTSFLVASDGPDAATGTFDDLLYLFTSVGTANKRTTLVAPHVFRWGASFPVRLSPTSALVCSAGPDGQGTTADDRVYLFDKLGSRNRVTVIDVPAIQELGAGVPVAFGDRVALVSTAGPDATLQTADDTVAMLTGLGEGSVEVTQIPVGWLGDDAGCRPVRLTSDTAALNTCGPDGAFGTPDDRIALLSGIGGTPAVSYIDMGGLDESNMGRPVPLGAGAFVLANGGEDGVLGSGHDDRVTIVRDAFGTPTFEHFASAGDVESGWIAHQPRVLGEGRIAFASPGADDAFRIGGDDLIQVIGGVATPRGLTVQSLRIGFSAEKPNRATTFSVKGTYLCDGLVPFGGEDPVFTIGNAAQTVPVKSFRARRGVFTYTSKSHQQGFLSKIVWNSNTGALKVTGKGKGTGGETTHAEYAVVGIQFGDFYAADHCVGEAGPDGITYTQEP